MAGRLSYDVAVVGGGPAGTMAAIASARSGARTLLVESQGFLGGMLTSAGTGPMMTFHAGETQVVRGIPAELVRRLVEAGLSPGHIPDPVGYCSSVTPFDAEGLKLVLEEMCRESGVELLYHAIFTECEAGNRRIDALRLFTKGGFIEVEPRVVVDASADADVARAAGAPTAYGRESDGLAQPMTLNAKVYNVDRERLKEYLRSHPDQTYSKDPATVDRASRCGISGAYALLEKAKQEGRITYNRETVLCFETNNPGEFIVNMTRIAKKSALSAFDLTEAEILGRRQVRETLAFLRGSVPGFERCVLASTGPSIGIRESSRLVGEYVLRAEDLVGNVMFDDAICMGGYPIDVHSPDGEAATRYRFLRSGSWYSVPYRSLVCKATDNLIVAGRCVSAEHEALAAIRVTPIAMAIGQAAGSAAAASAREGRAAHALDPGALRRNLVEQGAFLEPCPSSST
jgi:hypothetical protein